jgi:hypothetical protein
VKVGDKVQVMNSTLSGQPIVEGMATVVRLSGKPGPFGQRAMVIFDEDGAEGFPVERWIREEVQA